MHLCTLISAGLHLYIRWLLRREGIMRVLLHDCPVPWRTPNNARWQRLREIVRAVHSRSGLSPTARHVDPLLGKLHLLW